MAMHDVDDLIPMIEVANLLHVGKTNINYWANHTDSTGFPTPIFTTTAGSHWSRRAVIAWYITTYRNKDHKNVVGYLDQADLEAAGIKTGANPDAQNPH